MTLPGGFEKTLVGYCDPLSLRAGETVRFKISADQPSEAQARIVRLICGDDRPHGTGFLEEPVESEMAGAISVPQQPLVTGSYGEISGLAAVDSGSVRLWVYPTLLRNLPQVVVSMAGVELTVTSGGYRLEGADVALDLPFDVPLRRWQHLEVEFGETTTLSAAVQPVGVHETAQQFTTSTPGSLSLPEGCWRLACGAPGDRHFNGRLEGLSVSSTMRLAWNFLSGLATDEVPEEAGGPTMRLFQTPTRAVAGHLWNGEAQSFKQAPEHYGAAHFHEEDLTDAGWDDVVAWAVPRDLPSGQYALHVSQGSSEDYIPFFVRPAAGAPTADVAYLVPTASYLAYANQRLGFVDGPFGSARVHHANAAYLVAHEEVGYSLYEHHRDGSGVHFSSRLRPVLNMKPRTTTWAFNADTHITAWLHHLNQPFDVVTDEDLHLEGAAALAPYRTVITGTHPEYYSTAMHDGLGEWLGTGGRLMYMGGNGFYWRIAHHPENPAIIEVRRAEDGTRAWMSEPGEYFHQFSGEYGGMWRRLGRPPNKLVGIGFAAQGFDGGTYFRVMPGSQNPRVNFAMQGVDRTLDVWGNFGVQGGGAAGEEIDRWDDALGSPRHAVVLATSENHRPGMLRVTEEYHMTEPPRQDDPKVRADMVFFETPSGGAVFSTGSISYSGALCHNGYDNHISRITQNVLQRFLDPQPFEYPAHITKESETV